MKRACLSSSDNTTDRVSRDKKTYHVILGWAVLWDTDDWGYTSVELSHTGLSESNHMHLLLSLGYRRVAMEKGTDTASQVDFARSQERRQHRRQLEGHLGAFLAQSHLLHVSVKPSKL